jgi:hypothetical protein
LRIPALIRLVNPHLTNPVHQAQLNLCNRLKHGSGQAGKNPRTPSPQCGIPFETKEKGRPKATFHILQSS